MKSMKTGPAHLQNRPHSVRAEFVRDRISQNLICFPTREPRRLNAAYRRFRRDGLPAWEAMANARVFFA